MDRRQAVASLLQGLDDTLVVSGLGSPTYDTFAAGDRSANFYLWGAMGGAAMLGLGLALAQPARPVLVITGDGEALMGLGALATIAVKRPGNLTLAVLDNGHFGETGMQQSHSGRGLPLQEVAKASGFPASCSLASLEEVARYRAQIPSLEAGPRFARLVISEESPARVLPPRDGVYLKNRFRQNLGFPAS